MNLPLFNKYLTPLKYNDAFGHNPVWNIEIEKWLSSIDINYLEQYKGRFGSAEREKQRDNFLAELSVNYYLSVVLGWKLEELNPIGTGSHELEYIFLDNFNVLWHCEVKNSSWQYEIMSGDGSEREKKLRVKKPKYLKGDGRSFSFEDSYIKQIQKAEKQFKPEHNNLLIIVPDTFVSPLANPFLYNNLKDTITVKSPINNIAFLKYYLPSGENQITYNWKLFEIN